MKINFKLSSGSGGYHYKFLSPRGDRKIFKIKVFINLKKKKTFPVIIALTIL